MEKRKRTTSNSKNEPSRADRIGQLPDDVLGVIVSHLTLKEAGRTSVLSRRWKNLWTFTPHFNFDSSERMDQMIDYLDSIERERHNNVIESEREKFIRWVDQVVENHQGSDLDELVVAFGLDMRHSLHLGKWISFAVRKRVKAIEIDLEHYFPGSSGRYRFGRGTPDLSGIECLTSLCLKYVDITGETIEHLLSACPLLERLCLDCSEQLLNLRVVGASLKLKYLDISLCSPLESIEISAPSLMSFRYRRLWGTKTKLQVGDLCRLTDLDIKSKHSDYEFVQFSRCFFQLETLTLDCEFSERFLVLVGRPKLTNLKHLTLKIGKFPEWHMCGLAEFICLCPFLHKFTLELYFLANMEGIRITWGKWRPHQSLKVVEMIGFVGRKHEITIAKFFLKSAVKLEKLVIDTRCEDLDVGGEDDWLGDVGGEDDWLGNAVAPGSRERAERLRRQVPPGVELLIL